MVVLVLALAQGAAPGWVRAGGGLRAERAGVRAARPRARAAARHGSPAGRARQGGHGIGSFPSASNPAAFSCVMRCYVGGVQCHSAAPPKQKSAPYDHRLCSVADASPLEVLMFLYDIKRTWRAGGGVHCVAAARGALLPGGGARSGAGAAGVHAAGGARVPAGAAAAPAGGGARCARCGGGGCQADSGAPGVPTPRARCAASQVQRLFKVYCDCGAGCGAFAMCPLGPRMLS